MYHIIKKLRVSDKKRILKKFEKAKHRYKKSNLVKRVVVCLSFQSLTTSPWWANKVAPSTITSTYTIWYNYLIHTSSILDVVMLIRFQIYGRRKHKFSSSHSCRNVFRFGAHPLFGMLSLTIREYWVRKLLIRFTTSSAKNRDNKFPLRKQKTVENQGILLVFSMP